MDININTTDSNNYNPSECNYDALYGVIAVLSVLTVFVSGLSAFFFRLYKKEQNKRLKMWKVKMDDVFQNVQLSPSPVMKLRNDDSKMFNSHDELEIFPADDEFDTKTSKRKHYYTETCYYKGRLAAVKRMETRRMSFEKSRLGGLDQIFMLSHEHLCTFYGANHEGISFTILTEYCSRGSLQDLFDGDTDWDDEFKNSLIFDIVKGMRYLHGTIIGSHGNLKPSNCLIDGRFVVKISDFGAIGQRIKVKTKNGKSKENEASYRKLWTAPEILRDISPQLEGTKLSDVYSFAIIAQEIWFQQEVFYRKDKKYLPDEIVNRVMSPALAGEIFRPNLEDDDFVIIPSIWRRTLKRCWYEDPSKRPTFESLFEISQSFQKEGTYIDCLLERLQKYSNHLEEKVEEKTEQYKAEKERSDYLLFQMLPKSVAETLKKDKDVIPESYKQVTVYFSDIVGFSAICHQSQPLEVVQMLNDLYTMFDHIIDEFDVYKIETIGDAYMVASGLPIRNGDNHAREIARMALRLRHSVCNEFEIRHLPNEKMKLRIGIHTGPVVAGVVGLKMPRYCLFGDTVNTAARMEQNGKELKIHVSPQTKEVLEKFGTFDLRKRRQSVALKGIGEVNTWWLVGENGFSSPVPLKKRSFSIISTYVTGCFDDDDDLNVVNNHGLRPNLSAPPSLSLLKKEANLEQEAQFSKPVPRPPLYERRGSALFDLTKSKSSHRIKRRRQGIVNFSKPFAMAEQTLKSFPEDGSIDEESSVHALSSSSRSSKSAESLDMLDENHNHSRRTGYGATIPRDSGVSLAFDNKVYTDGEEKTSVP